MLQASTILILKCVYAFAHTIVSEDKCTLTAWWLGEPTSLRWLSGPMFAQFLIVHLMPPCSAYHDEQNATRIAHTLDYKSHVLFVNRYSDPKRKDFPIRSWSCAHLSPFIFPISLFIFVIPTRLKVLFPLLIKRCAPVVYEWRYTPPLLVAAVSTGASMWGGTSLIFPLPLSQYLIHYDVLLLHTSNAAGRQWMCRWAARLSATTARFPGEKKALTSLYLIYSLSFATNNAIWCRREIFSF